MFEYDISDEIERKMARLFRKDRGTLNALGNKIKEVISRDPGTIDFYKNLNSPLNDYKRVHIGHFVLTFRVFKDRNFIFFESFCHHDEAYGK